MQRDTLNLEALRQENEHIKLHTRRRMYIAVGVYLLILLGIFVFWLRGANDPGEVVGVLLVMPLFVILVGLPMWLLVISINHFRLYARAFRHFYQTYPDLPRRRLANLLFQLQGFITSFFMLFLVFGLPKIAVELGYEITLVHLLILFLIYIVLPNRLRDWFYFRPIRNGDYARAESMIRRIRSLFRRSQHFRLLHALVLFEGNNFEQAEQLSQELIAQAKHGSNPGLLCVALNNLGYHYVLAGRYEEGLPLLEQAISVFPFLSEPYDSLATYYTEQKLMPERAAQLGEMALFLNRNSPSKSIQLATHAYALAQQGKSGEAMQQLYEAEQKMPNNSIPVLAETQRQMGLAYLLLGDADRARNHLHRAANADPNGIYGKLAWQTLEHLPVPEGFTKESYFDL